MLTCPAALSIVLSYKPQVFSRLLTRCSFDAEGIHCRSPRWGRFTLRWDEIRTYGFGVNSFSYMSASFLYFSRNEVEYMPWDMVKRLDDVIRNERGGHFRRRPGA